MSRYAHGVRACALLVAVLWLLGAVAEADDLRGYVELTTGNVETSAESAGGEVAETSSDSLAQRINLLYRRRLFPNLDFRIGGLYDRTSFDQQTADRQVDSTATKLRPTAGLYLRTRHYRADITFERNEDRNRNVGVPTISRIRERYSSGLQWSPEGALPHVSLQVSRTNRYDGARTSEDATQDDYSLNADYSPVKPLRVSYDGRLSRLEDRLADNDVRSMTHTGRIVYRDSWASGRIAFGGDYDISHLDRKILSSGTGEIDSLLSRFAGLSSADRTPMDDPLDPNPALIDGVLVASAGINIGLPPVGGNDRPRNLGLDFVNEIEVNKLLVWVDRDLDEEIANAFTWEVWTSSDNDTWVPGGAVTSVRFGPFQNRFEIRFENVTARYVKIVTAPLSSSLPFAGEFPTILVTELQAVLTTPVAEVESRQSETSHVYNMNVRTRVLGSPNLSHELSYSLRKTGSDPSRWSVSNGFSLSHRLNEIYSVAARIARQNGRDEERTRTGLRYSASLTAAALETLGHSLIFSGGWEETAREGRKENNSVFLSNRARLYRGIDLNLGVGKSYATNEAGQTNETTQLNTTASLVPHRSMTVNLGYQDRAIRSARNGSADPSRSSGSSGSVGVAWNPLATLYLYASHRIEWRTGAERLTLNNYSANWSPFPGGSLRFAFNFTQALRSADDAKETTITPSLRWEVNARSYLQVSYQNQRSTGIVQESERDVLSGTLWMAF